MKKVFNLLIFVMLLTACSQNMPAEETTLPETKTATATSTPDPCAKENLPKETGALNRFMREFDDYTAIASNVPVAELLKIVPELQRIRRDAQDYEVPACLYKLKNLQLLHMEVVIQTLLSFMGSGDPALINQGIAKARELHDQYDVEIALLLGITPPPPPPPTVTLTPPS